VHAALPHRRKSENGKKAKSAEIDTFFAETPQKQPFYVPKSAEIGKNVKNSRALFSCAPVF
jgi:hypothetical protein